MIYLWYGDDDFSMRERLEELKQAIGPEAVRDVNVTELDGTDLSWDRLVAVCQTVPFMAERRLVVVRGLLSAAEGWGRERRGGRAIGGPGSQKRTAEEGSGLVGALEGMPQTTDMVFTDKRLSRDNSLRQRLERIARVQQFPNLRGEPLYRWVRERVARKGGHIDPPALRLLCDLVDGNLWAMDGELEKLVLYSGERPIGEEDVRALSTVAREASIFSAIDAILEGRAEMAQRLMQQLMTSGATVPYILAMLARQLRQLVLGRELLNGGASSTEVGKGLGITADFVLRKTVSQARATSMLQLRALYQRLLEADVAIKSGQMEGELGLQMLVSWATGPRSRERFTADAYGSPTTTGL